MITSSDIIRGRSFGNPLSIFGIPARLSNTRNPRTLDYSGKRFSGGVITTGGGVAGRPLQQVGEYYKELLTEVGQNLTASEIREILKVVSNPEYKDRLISFAGGIPDPVTFPINELRDGFNRFLLSQYADSAFQYGETAGIAPLRDHLAQMESRQQGRNFTRENILITTGSQQALDLIFTGFLERGTPLMAGVPIYLGCEQAAAKNGGYSLYLQTDDNGLIPSQVEDCVKFFRANETRRSIPTLLYVVPNFDNPTGKTIPLDRRQELLSLAQRHHFLIIEDDPYGALRYRGENIPSLKSMDDTGNVILCKSFSKTAMPGLRVGYVVADPVIIAKLELIKQGADLQSSSFSQYALFEYLRNNDIWEHVRNDIVPLYSSKMMTMLNALKQHFTGKWTSQSVWTKPDGGMFLWMTFPNIPGFDCRALVPELLEKTQVAWVSGGAFLGEPNTARFNFTKETPEKIKEGVRRIAKFVEDKCEELSEK